MNLSNSSPKDDDVSKLQMLLSLGAPDRPIMPRPHSHPSLPSTPGAINEQLLKPYFTSDFNDTVSELFHPSSYERGFRTSANVGIVLCTVGILSNLILLILLLNSRNLRANYLYIQIVSISLADLGFIVTVDSFTVYFELQPWLLGSDFCKAWMILDVALPSVSLFVLLLLNVDRVIFSYKTSLYHLVMGQTASLIFLVLFPWFINCTVVCSLWLGFPAVEPSPEICIYGITTEANTVSNWLTIFLPSLAILVLLIFEFIAVLGEVPSTVEMASWQRNNIFEASRQIAGQPQNSDSLSHVPREIIHPTLGAPSNGGSEVRMQRQFIAALLVVDFVSLTISLPYSAYSLLSPTCADLQSCESLRTLFQTLSWMRSSVTCIRPILFILLTDIYRSAKLHFAERYLRHELSSNATDQNGLNVHSSSSESRNESIAMAQIGFKSYSIRENSTLVAREESSSSSQGPTRSLIYRSM